MGDIQQERVTAALVSYLEQGESSSACDQLIALVYDDLRHLAAKMLRGERRDHTLSPTDLVHEAYSRLVDQTRVDWKGRTHFYAIAAQAMRRILIDHARRHGRQRRGGDWQRVSFDTALTSSSSEGLSAEELLALDAALERLAAIDPREARVVELRFFVGLGNEEIAQVLEVSVRSVARDWMHARSWLRRELAVAAQNAAGSGA